MGLYKLRFIIAGIVIAILYWIIEGFLHYFIFDFEGYSVDHLVEDLFYPIPHELYMRLIIFGLFILFGVYSYLISDKRAQDVASTERQRLCKLLDNIPALVYLQAEDCSIRYANRYFRERFKSPNNKKCYEVFFNFNQPCNKCQISSIFVKKLPIEVEWETKRGEFYQIYNYPFEDDNKELLALSLGIDITKRKKSEEALMRSEFRYQSLFDNMLEGFALCEMITDKHNNPVDFIYLEINDAFEELTGLKREDVIHKRVTEAIPDIKNFEPNLFEIYGKVASTGEPTKFEIYFSPLNIWLSISVYSFKKGYFVAVFDNITARKVFEEKLIESEEKFRTIAEQSVMGILIVQDGIIKYANESLSKINEYSIQEMMDWSPFELTKAIHPNERDIADERIEKISLGSKEIQPIYIYKMVSKSKKLKWVNSFSKKISYQNKDALLTTIIDVTEKVEAERLILDELNKLKELDQIKNDLIRRISHEIKTPLISIYSTTNLLLNVYKEEFSSKTLDFIMMINEGGERLKELVDNMLDVYDIESNRIKLNLKTQNLVDIVEKSISALQPHIVKRKHTIEVNLPSEVLLEVDYDRIKQVFLNLLINALKYTTPGGKIFVQLQEFNSHIDITIKDIGVGFTELEKEKLFLKFGKIERYGKGMNVDTEGPGFGLYIAKELTRLHNGEIILKSEGRNKGSTFIVRLFKGNYK
ncbi:hypothetical protein LCGC14_1102250 [marine sediment metagenome]|uniref:histidine kinase n=1 Tax=marine sediment metagenome TaxID=412755 RepID=A0A0F9QFC1_9ZZZZ